MNSFALYRLPYKQQVTLMAQKEDIPIELNAIEQLDGHSGFVLAPFTISRQYPLIVIRPDVVETYPDAASVRDFTFQIPTAAMSHHCQVPLRDCYAANFKRFHSQLCSGRFSKIVLSRCATIPSDNSERPVNNLTAEGTETQLSHTTVLALFRRACQRYPRLFIALVSTPKSGMWLTATPEVLLESSDDGRWHTMALAGTMRLDDYPSVAWSEKNMEEQRFVAAYITNCLQHFSNDVEVTEPRTVRAANLVHLRSDFHFSLYNNTHVGKLLQALHPTPAVCGLPKEEAYQFIMANEHTPRLYYTGFMGPFCPTPSSSTHLFVSLRCMQISSSHYRLFAGGGLLKESNEEQEWQETEAKMETMKGCLYSS